MHIKVDEDLPAQTVERLRGAGYDARSRSAARPARAPLTAPPEGAQPVPTHQSPRLQPLPRQKPASSHPVEG